MHITLVYGQSSAKYLADVSRTHSEMLCQRWEVLRYEPLAERNMLRVPAMRFQFVPFEITKSPYG